MLAFYLSQIETESGRNRFTELYHKHYKLMFAVAFEKSKSTQSAEDIVHNAFVRVIKVINEDRLDNEQNVEGYLLIVGFIQWKLRCEIGQNISAGGNGDNYCQRIWRNCFRLLRKKDLAKSKLSQTTNKTEYERH